MKRVLDQLYHGELYPYAEFQTTIEEYRTNRDKAFHSYSAFLEKLPEELKSEFIQVIDENLSLLPYEMEQTFIDGFSIAIRMMAEVYSTPTSQDDE